MPHRPVFKDSSYSVRPVFDAGAKDRNGISLISCMFILRFRPYEIGIVSDIEKVFMQIEVNPTQRDLIRFLWLSKDNEEKIFRFRRLPFGVCSSPFILCATTQHHIEIAGGNKKLMNSSNQLS